MSIRDEARDEYVRRAVGPSVGTIGDRLALAWEAGAEWQASRPIPEDEAYCDRGPCWMHLGHDGPCQQDGPEMCGVMWERRREPTEEEVEAAAKVLFSEVFQSVPDVTWENSSEGVRDNYRVKARATVRAAREAAA